MDAWTACLDVVAVSFIIGHVAASSRGKLEMAHRLAGLVCVAYAVLALLNAAGRHWPVAVFELAIAVAWFWLWWRNRRKRKRSLRALGHKARARLAAMARNMPRLTPRLVPQRVPA